MRGNSSFYKNNALPTENENATYDKIDRSKSKPTMEIRDFVFSQRYKTYDETGNEMYVESDSKMIDDDDMVVGGTGTKKRSIIAQDPYDASKSPGTRIVVKTYNKDGPDTLTSSNAHDKRDDSIEKNLVAGNKSIADAIPRPLGSEILTQDSDYDVPSKKRKTTTKSESSSSSLLGDANADDEDGKSSKKAKKEKDSSNVYAPNKTNIGDHLKRMAIHHILESNNKMVQFVSKFIAMTKVNGQIEDFFAVTKNHITQWRKIEDYGELMDVLSQDVPELHDDVMLHLTESLTSLYASALESHFGDVNLDYDASPVKDLKTLYRKLSLTGEIDEHMLKLLTMKNPSLDLKFSTMNDTFFSALNVENGKHTKSGKINAILNRKMAILHQVEEHVKRIMNSYNYSSLSNVTVVFKPEFQGLIQNCLNYLYIKNGTMYTMNDIVNSNVVSTLFISLIVSFEKAFTNSVNTRPSDPFDFKGSRSADGANVADRMQSGKYSGKDQTVTQMGRSNTYNIIGSKSRELRSIENSELSALLQTFKNRVRKNYFDGRLEYLGGEEYEQHHHGYAYHRLATVYEDDHLSSSSSLKHRDAAHLDNLFASLFDRLKHLKRLHEAMINDKNREEPSNPFRTLMFQKNNSGTESKRAIASLFSSSIDDRKNKENGSAQIQNAFQNVFLSRYNIGDGVMVGEWS